MPKTLFILNDPPYGTERSYNALRLAGSLSTREAEDVKVFLIGDAAGCAKRDQKVPQGHYNTEVMLRHVGRHGGEIGVCGTCMDARGISDAELTDTTHRSSLEELTNWVQWADRTLGVLGKDEEPWLTRRPFILGGGVGGVATARALRKRLPKAHRVVLVDRERDHVFAPSLLWLMIGQRTAEAITRPLARLARKGIDVRLGHVEYIDPERRIVTVGGQALPSDYLVITLGAELAPELIPGLAQAGHNFYTCGGAQSLRTALERLRSGRIVVLTAAPAYKCPAAPYEGAMLIADWYRKREIRDRVQIEVYAAEPAPMGVADPHVSSAVTQLLAARGIPYHPEHQVAAADAGRKRLTFANGVQVDFDLLAYVPPHRAPAVIRDSGLTGESGWMSVDRHTLETRWPHVYAIGDVVSIPLALGKPLPKAGVFAHREAEVVAENIAQVIAGQVGPARFDGHGECFIEIGGGKAGFGGGDFYAEPKPAVTLRQPSRRWHLGKVWVEKSWLYSQL